MKLTTTTMQVLEDWVSKGRRNVKIEIERYGFFGKPDEIKTTVQCYDYDLTVLKSINEVSEIPTAEEMLEEFLSREDNRDELAKKYKEKHNIEE